MSGSPPAAGTPALARFMVTMYQRKRALELAAYDSSLQEDAQSESSGKIQTLHGYEDRRAPLAAGGEGGEW